MVKETFNSSESTELFVYLDNQLRSLRQRGVYYSVTSFSGECAVIEVGMIGKKGEAKVRLVIVKSNLGDNLLKNYKWFAYTNTSKYKLDSLSEVKNVARHYVARLRTIVTKIY
jgi:hypothetical protein